MRSIFNLRISRLLSVISMLLLTFCLASCGGGGGDNSGDPEENEKPGGEEPAEVYTVTYDADGGNLASVTQSVTVGESYTLATPDRVGYSFLGWYNGENKVEGGKWTIKSDVTLKAKWEIITYSISYGENAGEHSNATSYTIEDSLTLTAPTRVGYRFAGWTYDGQNDPVLEVKIEKGSVGDKTYTANWTANQYTLTYDPNGGTLASITQAVEYGSGYELAIPVMEGYTFLGWYEGTTRVENGIWERTSGASLKAEWIMTAWYKNAKFESKITADVAARTILFKQEKTSADSPAVDFTCNGEEISGYTWFVSGTINTKTVSGKSGHIYFTATKDSSNVANLILNRRVDGVNGVYRNITQDGVRTPSGSGNEQTYGALTDTTDWTGEFVFIYYRGYLALYLREAGGEFAMTASYRVSWSECSPSLMIKQNANVTISNMNASTDAKEVEKMYYEVENMDYIASLRVLFIGNSATSVNDVPSMVNRLARKAGYNLEYTSLTKGGSSLSTHADATTDHGKQVLEQISLGYDVVIIQDVTSCIKTEANREASIAAAKVLGAAIKESGAEAYIYVRPPTGTDIGSYKSYEQCIEYDKLFNTIASDIDATNVYVNRACAYVIKNYPEINIWGSDNAHLNKDGAYLTACVFFATLFNTSAVGLDLDGLSAEMAATMQSVADQIVFGGYIPE